MATFTHETVPTTYVQVGEIRIAYRRFGKQGQMPLLMLNNSYLLAENLPHGQLIMYPDASHGAQSQYAEIFLEHVRLFMNS